MSDYPLVSCLMPTKNRRQFIPRALKMWREQDYPNKELIVIEDGPGCVEDLIDDEVSLYQEPRIRYAPMAGTLGAKLNFGRVIAGGSIIINWDDDDYNAPNRTSLQVQHLQMTGKPFVGFSSLIFYREGEDHGNEYTGNAWYCSGSTHCYTREWALAHPRPDITVGEDNIAVEEARQHRALSTISGTRCLVASDHSANCSRRRTSDEYASLTEFLASDEMAELSDNIKRIPLSEFADTIACGNL